MRVDPYAQRARLRSKCSLLPTWTDVQTAQREAGGGRKVATRPKAHDKCREAIIGNVKCLAAKDKVGTLRCVCARVRCVPVAVQCECVSA